MPSPHRLVLDPYKLVLAPVYTGWRAVGWVWLSTAKNVAEFLAEEAGSTGYHLKLARGLYDWLRPLWNLKTCSSRAERKIT
jgi:hypothetical protein